MSNVFIEIEGNVINITEDQELTATECYEITNTIRNTTLLEALSNLYDIDMFIE